MRLDFSRLDGGRSCQLGRDSYVCLFPPKEEVFAALANLDGDKALGSDDFAIAF